MLLVIDTVGYDLNNERKIKIKSGAIIFRKYGKWKNWKLWKPVSRGRTTILKPTVEGAYLSH
jgi:hypothetical protein